MTVVFIIWYVGHVEADTLHSSVKKNELSLTLCKLVVEQRAIGIWWYSSFFFFFSTVKHWTFLLCLILPAPESVGKTFFAATNLKGSNSKDVFNVLFSYINLWSQPGRWQKLGRAKQCSQLILTVSDSVALHIYVSQTGTGAVNRNKYEEICCSQFEKIKSVPLAINMHAVKLQSGTI